MVRVEMGRGALTQEVCELFPAPPAAIGVLNAAASAAAAPMGTKALTFSLVNFDDLPNTEAMPAPTWTAGPSPSPPPAAAGEGCPA